MNPPSPDNSRLFLTGYMGAGKSTIGKLLASRLKYRFVDTDRMLVRRFKKSVTRIFREDGEIAFREAEMTALQELLAMEGVVISTGGGTLVREDTLALALAGGTVIYLRAPVGVLYERVIYSPKDRPMIDVPDAETSFRERFAQREAFYNRAHFVVDTADKALATVIDEIADWLAIGERMA